jgi:hypothetical protein
MNGSPFDGGDIPEEKYCTLTRNPLHSPRNPFAKYSRCDRSFAPVLESLFDRFAITLQPHFYHVAIPFLT